MYTFGIIGLARSGIAAARKLQRLGHTAFLSDSRPASAIAESAELQANFPCEFGGHTECLLDCRTIIVSPGVPLNIPILQAASQRGIELISEIELGFRLKAADSSIIAVTGSNGKSTTVSLIHHLLTQAGVKVLLAGNIGSAFTAAPVEEPGTDVFVLELSSFQLELIDRFHPRVSVLLNITPDHLNRYPDMNAYARAKFNIFRNQTREDLAVLNEDDPYGWKFSHKLKSRLGFFSLQPNGIFRYNGSSINYQDAEFSLEHLPLRGPHNHANIMAALLAVSDYKINNDLLKQALASFQPLPHRLETVAQVRGITFINDSKATNTDSVRYALQSFPRRIRLIMGGAGKGEDYRVLNNLLATRAEKVYLTGDSQKEMSEAFSGVVELASFPDIAAAV
ncbi:MAG: UDP-N-acetylmuramoyl-L-alanine--D-glutamate ligase, partial [Candidatus Cloacimonetes bacterium]|nr:UDP-N-acetylmuramoyl-L-alanine--D-glutamate ligase [Candidatus Cloacimonadota bacterium]